MPISLQYAKRAQLLCGASASANPGGQGHVRHEYDGPRFVFSPTVSRPSAQASALKQVLRTFFDGSASNAVAALLDLSKKDLSEDELDKLSKLVEKARREGR